MSLIRIVACILLALCITACKTTAPLSAYQNFSDKQIFERAEKNMHKHNYEQAAKDFEALDALYPFGQYSQPGQLQAINAYYENGDKDAALAAADRYIRLYPRAEDVDYAYYMKGVINQGPPGGWYEKWLLAEPTKRDVAAQQEALESFSTLVERFPQSKYAPKARAYIMTLRSHVAQHMLSIAQYYLQRKIYVAAANRATDLITHYPNTPQVAPALDILAKSYTALNEPLMAEKTRQVLQEKYPNFKSPK